MTTVGSNTGMSSFNCVTELWHTSPNSVPTEPSVWGSCHSLPFSMTGIETQTQERLTLVSLFFSGHLTVT